VESVGSGEIRGDRACFSTAGGWRTNGSEVQSGVPMNIVDSTKRLREPAALGALLLGASSAPAYAYLDPGMGSMLLQLMLGGVAGAAVVGKLYMRRAKEFFRGRQKPDDQ